METLLKCRKFEVVRKNCVARSGELRPLEFVLHPGAVVILPLLEDGRVVLIRQFRHALDKELWELPAGTLDVPGEDPAAAARRELEEETGFVASQVDYLCEFHPSPGILTELIRAYVAKGLRPTRQQLEPMERITVESMPMSRALEMVRDGRIADGKTMIALLMYESRRGVAP